MARNAVAAQPAAAVVGVDHPGQAAAAERRLPSRVELERLGQKALRQAVLGARPALAQVEEALADDDPPRAAAEFVLAHVPARDRAQQRRPLGPRLVEDPAQELAEDQRV